jgi:hypothetical protein
MRHLMVLPQVSPIDSSVARGTGRCAFVGTIIDEKLVKRFRRWTRIACVVERTPPLAVVYLAVNKV